MNALQDWFDDDNDLPRSNDRERFDRGMFISINNHKQCNDDLYGSLKKQYQSLIYALTGSNPSRDQIKVTDKLPAQRTILQLMAKKRVVVAAALHTYDAYNQKTGRGSRYNLRLQPPTLLCFWFAPLMQQHKGGVDAAVEHIRHCLFRHNRSNPNKSNNIDIREVGVGKYQYNDVVTPTTLLDYLALPKTNPTKDCIINYMSGAANDGAANPILYLYQTGV